MGLLHKPFCFWLMGLFNYSEPWQLGFQAAGSPVMGEIVHLHAEVLFILVLISTVVIILFSRVYVMSYPLLSFCEGGVVEVVWTMIPGMILILMGMPSLSVLYSLEEVVEVGVSVKVVGHQWYWSYEVQNLGGEVLEFDSYMAGGEDLGLEGNSLLEADNSLLLPVGEDVNILVIAADVLHSFAVPSLGLKMDAVPGSLNQLLVKVNSPGVYYGQCSEMCGANHSFMPIVVEGVSMKEYNEWMKSLE